MPIYEYRCSACGFENEYLQKLTDPQLNECPECGKPTFTKKVTAAGFQLKGTGWYVTDFRGGHKAREKSKSDEDPASKRGAPADKAAQTAQPAAAGAGTAANTDNS
jgi:putative FmdB family regulatory protein